jgi:hypothetical protein
MFGGLWYALYAGQHLIFKVYKSLFALRLKLIRKFQYLWSKLFTKAPSKLKPILLFLQCVSGSFNKDKASKGLGLGSTMSALALRQTNTTVYSPTSTLVNTSLGTSVGSNSSNESLLDMETHSDFLAFVHQFVPDRNYINYLVGKSRSTGLTRGEALSHLNTMSDLC